MVVVDYYDPDLVDYGTFCPGGRDDCRWSDATLVSYANAVDWRKGVIAQTSSADRWSGSTTISDNLYISDKYNPPSVGDTLHKVGATSGWTYGDVDETCEHYSVTGAAGTIYLMCQDVVNAGADHGDSGSPVFLQVSSDTVELAGILWGGDPAGTSSGARFVFSRIGAIEDDFNTTLDILGGAPLSVNIVGNDEVPPETTCTWQAFATGGESPYSYSWSGVLSGSGTGTGTTNFISGVVNSSGYLHVTVSSNDGQEASYMNYSVTVSEEVEECPE